MKIRILMTALLFAVSNAFSQVPSYVPTNGLVGWWPFNGNANDESGNGNNGIVNGPSLTSDRSGNPSNAYQFNSGGDLICTSNSFNIPNVLTYSVWMKSSSIGFLMGFNNGQCSHGGNWDRTMIIDGTNQFRFYTFPGTQVSTVASINIINNQWNHIVITMNGSGSKIYVNGGLVVSNASQTAGENFIGYFRFGGLSPNGINNSVVGILDDIGIWNRALSASEIQQLYTTQVPCTLTSNFFATDTITACGNSVTLNPQNSGANYLWSNNATTQSITVNTTGWYKCTVSQGSNCFVSDSVYVKLPNALPTSLQAGLVGYWSFCGNANDESGNGNNGTVNGATLTSDRLGNLNNAFFFDGNGDSITVPNIPYCSNYTFSGWFLCDTLLTPYPLLYNQKTTYENNRLHILGSGYISPNYGSLFTGDDNNGNLYTSSIQVNDGSWHYVSVVYDHQNTIMKMYIDGSYNGSSALNNISTFSGRTKFGNGFTQQPNPPPYDSKGFHGKLDDFVIWNRALTTTEVQQLYAAQSSNTTSNSNSGNSNSASSINNLPKGISYQAVARDSAGTPLSSANVEVRFTLRDSSVSGTVVYKEVHTLTTNQFGLFTTAIGIGTVQTGDYNTINWMGPAKYLDVEIKQGANYLLMGSQQLLAVPYANAATSAGEIKNSQVPVFADNSAALAGGLQVGDMYRTSSGALMIVY